jgi:hypothetical protein
MEMACPEATFQFSSAKKTMKEASPFHGIPMLSLLEQQANPTKMMMVNDFLATSEEGIY